MRMVAQWSGLKTYANYRCICGHYWKACLKVEFHSGISIVWKAFDSRFRKILVILDVAIGIPLIISGHLKCLTFESWVGRLGMALRAKSFSVFASGEGQLRSFLRKTTSRSDWPSLGIPEVLKLPVFSKFVGGAYGGVIPLNESAGIRSKESRIQDGFGEVSLWAIEFWFHRFSVCWL